MALPSGGLAGRCLVTSVQWISLAGPAAITLADPASPAQRAARSPWPSQERSLWPNHCEQLGRIMGDHLARSVTLDAPHASTPKKRT